MRTVGAAEIDGLLAWPALIDALFQAFSTESKAPVRHHHHLAGPADESATHLIMPAWTSKAPGPGAYLGTKIVNVFPGNRSRGLPSVSGVYVLQSGGTGEPLAVMDGTRLTLWRTAAASALAARYLAREDSARLLVVGAGALAPFLVRAHASVRPIRSVTIWNYRPEGAAALAANLAREGVRATVAADLRRAVGQADIVSCATLSRDPLVRGEWLEPGTHLDLVGAFSMTMREADDEALLRARVFVDTSAALVEGGDIAVAIRDGALPTSRVLADLQALCRGTARGRRGEAEITLFKSVGSAIEDLAAAILVWEGLLRAHP